MSEPSPWFDAAVTALERGEVVAIPTDTVYGVAAVLAAAPKLFAVKRRPPDVDLPVLVAEPDDGLRLADPDRVPEYVHRLAARHWPGPLTLVLPRAALVTADLGAHRETIGVRCPDHDLVRELCRRAGPLATTSANLHGQPPLTTAAAVRATFPDLVVVDGGECAGTPSTVVDCTGDAPRVLRQGAVDVAGA